MSRTYTGISSLMVLVILVPAVVLITVLSATWIMGLWHSVAETFVVRPMVHVSFSELNSTPVLVLYIENDGATNDTILEVDIVSGDGMYVNTTKIGIPAGFSDYVTIDRWSIVGSPKPLSPGSRVRVIIHTAIHGTMPLDIVVS